jgi:hypothetical protein
MDYHHLIPPLLLHLLLIQNLQLEVQNLHHFLEKDLLAEYFLFLLLFHLKQLLLLILLVILHHYILNLLHLHLLM